MLNSDTYLSDLQYLLQDSETLLVSIGFHLLSFVMGSIGWIGRIEHWKPHAK